MSLQSSITLWYIERCGCLWPSIRTVHTVQEPRISRNDESWVWKKICYKTSMSYIVSFTVLLVFFFLFFYNILCYVQRMRKANAGVKCSPSCHQEISLSYSFGSAGGQKSKNRRSKRKKRVPRVPLTRKQRMRQHIRERALVVKAAVIEM